MKNLIILSAALLAVGQLSVASPPALINYQGKLLNTNGAPVNGSVSVDVDLFSTDTGGSPIYSESIGSVAVIDGIYSFGLGEAGLSYIQTTETLGIGNGVQQVFNKTVANIPMVNPSVTISDGTYTWDDVGGSSNPSQFSGTAIHASGFVSAVYLSAAPASGTVINVSYTFSSASIEKALSAGTSTWIEITIDGIPLEPRQRLSSSAYAIEARTIRGNRMTIDPISGNVGIGTQTPISPLTVSGMVYSTTGGFKFPDGSIQTSSSSNPSTNSILVSDYIVGAAQSSARVKFTANGVESPYYARVYLPNGATVKTVYGELYDACYFVNGIYTGGQVTVSFTRLSMDDAWTNIASYSTPFPFVSGNAPFSIPITTNNVVDNEQYAYYIEGLLDADANGGGCGGSWVGVNKILIQYVK